MKILLDTHLLVWAMCDEEKLGSKAIYYMDELDNTLYYSTASIWEIAIKHARKPEQMRISAEQLHRFCERFEYYPLPIKAEHVLATSYLQPPDAYEMHKDPFDRLLIAQAKTEGMRFMTRDRKLFDYDEPCILRV